MHNAPQKEHEWLMQLVGEWTYEGECAMGSDQPMMKFNGRETIRSLGGLWILIEGEGDTPDGSKAQMMITLGFDPDTSRYVGTFISSMGGFLWHYDGAVDAAGKVLTLDAEGPTFDGKGMAKYQDIIEILSPDHHTLSSQILGEDGKWTRFMTTHYRRSK
jgi:hypothetical protein